MPEHYENKRKHLEMIQAIIARMAHHSFLLKGWTVTLVAAVMVLQTKTGLPFFGLISLVIVVAFWLLDAYFLQQERRFRGLYDGVREKAKKAIDFSMDISPYHKDRDARFGYWAAAFSRTLLAFYGGLAVVAMAIMAAFWLDKT